MTALAEASGARIIVHENFQFQPWYRAIKAAIEDRAIGTVQLVSFRRVQVAGRAQAPIWIANPIFNRWRSF